MGLLLRLVKYSARHRPAEVHIFARNQAVIAEPRFEFVHANCIGVDRENRQEQNRAGCEADNNGRGTGYDTASSPMPVTEFGIAHLIS